MQNIITLNYINTKDKELVEKFINSDTKKYILGINKLGKSVAKLISVDGIIDDFTRVQSSIKKKNILDIKDIPKDSIILWAASGSPLEVKNTLEEMGYTHISYLAFYKYSSLELAPPPFILDFEDDFKKNRNEYEKVFNLLNDEKSKEIFQKIINFKISFDYNFMTGFTNNFEEQYFDKELISDIKDIVFVDGGGYIGDTIPSIIKNFPTYKKIYVIEPNHLHINIAKKNFKETQNIKFIECGLSNKIVQVKEKNDDKENCRHDYEAENLNTIDNIINEKVDFIKLDIEGAEQDALNGAKNTIKEQTPILAICVYHKAEDWYKVPQIVLDINPNYDIYLRHYMEGIYETVMYFIPKIHKS